MTRKEIVYRELKSLTDDLALEDLREEADIGFDAQTISNIVGIERSNVSRELNNLVRERRAIKLIGRPVRFLAKESLDKFIVNNYDGDLVFENGEDFLKICKCNKFQNYIRNEDPFGKLIGASQSLELPIKQAKAAILYPPKGLHTLITGATGVGKTTFAEVMYKYALYTGSISKDGELVIFNCSEYADNPQLILSQLFGHVKGAFTGADQDKPGLIEKANEGILLLDEIHRLSPEAQEMLFLLIDKGVYRKLGETEKYREANVLIIGATTEDINSVLLQTFIRRIPMIINLPSLEERSLNERMEFIDDFFIEEVSNVKVPIKVHRDVIRAFLLYNCQGNIGQLKGDIQLLCARGFLDYKTYNKKGIEIDIHFLPEHIYNGLLNQHTRRDEVLGLLQYEKEYYVYTPKNIEKFVTVDNYNLSDNLYREITKKYNYYVGRGYSEDTINKIINDDIEKYLKKLLGKCNVEKGLPGKKELFKIINPKVYDAAEKALMLAEQTLERCFSRRVVIGLAMHISALMERIFEGEIVYYEEINKIALSNPKEFRTARLMREILQEELEISIPKEEIGFLSMFLSAVDTNEDYKKIGVIVLAHGKSTATSIANVANSLLGTNHCKAIDMPLNVKVEAILKKTTEMVKTIDDGKGVLLLVDMGSLTAFSEIITQKTKIPTKSVENISTPIVIEAVRKSLLPEMTLQVLVEEINKVNPYIGRMVCGDIKNKVNILTPKIILTTCISGKGAAVKIAQLLRNTLPFIEEYNVKIQPLNITEKFNLDNILSDDDIKNLVAVIGTVDLHIPNVPFISIDELIIGDGIRKIEKSIRGLDNYYKREELSEENMFINMLEEVLTFLDPIKAYNLVNDSYLTIVKLLEINNTTELKTRYIFHSCCMVERLIQDEVLPYNDVNGLIQNKRDIYEKVKFSLIDVEEFFGIVIPDTEVGYIIDLLDT